MSTDRDYGSYIFDAYVLDARHVTLTLSGESIHVEPQVFQLLYLLVRNSDRIVSRDEIYEEIWQGRAVSAGIIDSRIHAARQAIGDDGKTQKYIKTFPNNGFRFVGDVEASSNGSQTETSIGLDGSKTQTGSVKPIHTPKGKGLVSRFALATGTALALVGGTAFLYSQSGQSGGDDAALSENAPTTRPSIVVLPSQCPDGLLSDAESVAPFVDETVMLLSRIGELSVVSRAVVNTIESQNFDGDQVDEAFDVTYRVESECIASDRLLVRLVQSSDEMVLVSRAFDLPSDNSTLFTMQLASARSSVQSIANALGVTTEAARAQILDEEAFLLFNSAIEDLESHEKERLGSAISKLEEIIATNPDYLPAYARLYEATYNAIIYGGLDLTNAIDELERIVTQMKFLAPNSPETYTVRAALLQLNRTDNVDEEIGYAELLARARAAGPNYAPAFFQSATQATYNDSFADAQMAIEQALQLDPVSSLMLEHASWTQFNLGNEAAALEIAERSLRWHPDDQFAQNALARLYTNNGDYVAAYRLLTGTLSDNPENYSARFNLHQIYRELGQYRLALNYTPDASYSAVAHALLGNSAMASEYAMELPNYRNSARALYLLGDTRLLYDWQKNRDEFSRYSPDQHSKSPVFFRDEVDRIEVFQRFADPEAEESKANAKSYLDQKRLEEFYAVDDYVGAIAFYALIDEPEKAFQVWDQANERKIVFLGSLEFPMFDALRDDPRYPEYLEVMQLNANAIITSFGSVQDK